jgi:hypothetical protein
MFHNLTESAAPAVMLVVWAAQEAPSAVLADLLERHHP